MPNIGDVYVIEGMNFKIVDIQTITYGDGSTSTIVISSLVV